MFVEWWVVGEYASGVVVNFETFGDRFYYDAGASEVVNHPMEFRGRKLVAIRSVAEVNLGKQGFSFGDGGTLTKNPGKKFKLGDIVFAVDVVIIDSVTNKVEAGHAETFFVDSVIK